jgi:hypothetical protein
MKTLGTAALVRYIFGNTTTFIKNCHSYIYETTTFHSLLYSISYLQLQ